MKNFVVTLDVTMSGDIKIEAPNEKAAVKMVQSMYFSARDLKNFQELNKDIFEVKEVE